MIKLLIESSSWEDASVDATYLDRVHQYQEDTVTRVKDLRDEVEVDRRPARRHQGPDRRRP